jgi:hypothetical protein
MRIVLDSEPHPNAFDDDSRMGLMFGSPISQDKTCTTDVVVNVFDGGPRTTVEYRIGERAPVRMKRESRPDPFVKEVFARNQATKKPWAGVELCSHIWVARLPADLEAGIHCIMVRAVDEYDREHHERLCLEVVGTQAAGGDRAPLMRSRWNCRVR